MMDQQLDWTARERCYAARYLAVCREITRFVPPDERHALLRVYSVQAKSDVAGVERAWAREKQRRGLG